MPDIQLDPEPRCRTAAQLAEVADRLLVVAARLAADDFASDVHRLGAALASRQGELVGGLRRNAELLTELAERLRHGAEAISAVDGRIRRELGAIGRCLE